MWLYFSWATCTRGVSLYQSLEAFS